MVDKQKTDRIVAILKDYVPMARQETLEEIAQKIVAALKTG